MVGLGRLERPTSPLSGVRSNHLSYRPARPLYESPARNATPAAPRHTAQIPRIQDRITIPLTHYPV